MGDIESTDSNTLYFAPKAEDMGLPTADRHVFRAMENELSSVDKCWCGVFADASHNINFRDKRTKAGDVLKSWLFPFCHYSMSAILVWPVELESPPKHKEYQDIVFKNVVAKLQWVVIKAH